MNASINTREAADRLGCTVGWVAALCRNGVLDAEGGGKGQPWRINETSVEELANASVTPGELERAKQEIEQHAAEIDRRAQSSEEDWSNFLVRLLKKIGEAVLLSVGGAVGGVVGGPIGVAVGTVAAMVLVETLEFAIKKARGH